MMISEKNKINLYIPCKMVEQNVHTDVYLD